MLTTDRNQVLLGRLNLYGSIPRSLLRTISLLIPRRLLRGRCMMSAGLARQQAERTLSL